MHRNNQVSLCLLQVEMSRSDEAEGGGQGERQKKKQTIPHLINLNEDPQLSRVIVHFLEQGTNRIMVFKNGKCVVRRYHVMEKVCH